MSRRARLLVLIASLALVAVYFAPLWQIDLEAPQYPEGLGMRIWVNTITGLGEYDLKKINQLNHYIGMKVIEPDSIAELDLMPWIVGFLILGGLTAAAVGRRWLLAVWVGVFAIAAGAGLVDFWSWEYDYGHDLDPSAAIKIPGMSYQPPLIGSKQILNFTAHSWPGPAGWAAMAAFALAVLALALELFGPGRRRRGASRGGAVLLLWLPLAVGLAGCAPGPEPIVYGSDQGEYCRMTISDERYGAELVTRRGKVYKFDSVECLAAYRLEMTDSTEVHSLWVTDFADPPTLIRVEDAFFLESRDLRSPMGGNLTAFGTGMTREAVLHSFFGEILSWDEVLDRVRHRGVGDPAGPGEPDSRDPTHDGHGGHGDGGAVPGAHPGAGPGGGAAADTGALRVSPAGPIRTVAEAVARAEPGSRIVVEAGVYREPTIVVDRPVEIVGRGGPVLDGEGSRQIMTVTADDVTVSGLVFRDVGTSYVEDRSAIRVEDARRCRIEGNRFEDAFFGIYLASTAGCVVAENVMQAHGERETASGNGIHLWYSKEAVIRNNEIRGHRDGIYFEFVEGSRIEGNLSEANLRYGLHFMFSDDCVYEGNVFRRNGAGVAVMYTEGVEMRGNVFERNWGNAAFGLLLKDIRRSRIEDNVFLGNSIGVYAEGVTRVEVRGNRFRENGWAVKIMANSLDNVFTRNDFVGNTFDVATNSRQSYSAFRENYWDAYRGYDLDRDGYGDVPFRPVRLFSLIVERNEPSLVLLRSLLVTALDAAERVIPSLTPETLVDERPLMGRAS